MVCWLGEKAMVLGGKYTIRHTTAELRCVIRDVKYKMDINTLEENPDDKNIVLNEIARVSIKTTKPLFYDSYTDNRISGSISIGSGILIYNESNITCPSGCCYCFFFCSIKSSISSKLNFFTFVTIQVSRRKSPN